MMKFHNPFILAALVSLVALPAMAQQTAPAVTTAPTAARPDTSVPDKVVPQESNVTPNPVPPSTVGERK
jgi:hypothetical protein